MKNCPFNHSECNSSCALFISPDDLNELMASRLSSLGVFSKDGMCALKTLALSGGRFMFENTATTRRH